MDPSSRIWDACRRSAAALALSLLVVGCKPPPATNAAPSAGPPVGGLEPAGSTLPAESTPPSVTGNAAASANVAAPPEALPDDPLELARLSVEAHAEKVRLISTVKDLETAKAVSGTFPAVDTRHRLLEEKLGSRLLTEEVEQQIDQQYKAQRDQLQKDYAREYVRVAFIPGAWEHMHPELAPFADMTVIGQDAASLEREVVRMLTESILLMRQVTDIDKALELSPRYRVATCRIGSVLSRLNVASGGSGIREIQPPQVTALRKQSEEERKRFLPMHGVYHALRYGERPAAAPAAPNVAGRADRSAIDQLVGELRSQDRSRIINALNRLPETTPDPAHEAIATETLRLFAFEPVRGSAVETIKRGWFSPSQIPQIREAMPTLEDRGYRYMLAEGISRTPNLAQEDIEFLATLFDEEPGKAVSVLRNVGPAAETVAHQYADSAKVEVRKCVCELLKDIGSEASLPVLQKLTQDSDRGVVAKAQEAIREIGKPIDQRPHLRDRRPRS
jgi:hypothetical protein